MYKILSAAAVIALSLSAGAQASPLAASLAQVSQDELTIRAQAETKPAKPARKRVQQPRRQQPQQRQQQQQQPPAGGGGGFLPG